MPNVRQVTGNYTELAAKMFAEYPERYSVGTEKKFTTDSKNITTDLLKDLNRQPYFPSNGLTYEEHVAHWMAPSTSKAYSQGNMTASFFTLSIKDFILLNPKFIQNLGWFSSLLNKLRGIPTREEDNRMNYFHMDNHDDFSVAYFDDHGISCGVSIAYSKLNPTIWTATIIRNTTAAPEEREVFMISPTDIMSHLKKEGLTSATQAATEFFNFLKCKSLAEVIGKDIISAKGEINLAQVERLRKQYNEKRKVDALGTVNRLLDQEHIIKEWELTPEQFVIVNKALLSKQQKNILEREDWFKTWSKEQHEKIKVPALETASRQSFFRRNIHNIFVGVAATVTLIGFALVLSGVLAPLGLALIGSTATILGAVGAGTALLIMLSSFIKLGVNEKNLSTYKAELPEKQKASETLIEGVRQRICPEVDAKINTQNEPEQITRAILNANFSTEEFKELANQVDEAKKPTADEVVHDEISELEQLFAQEENALEEIVDGTLGEEAARETQHLEHSHSQERLAEAGTITDTIPVNTDEHAQYNNQPVGVY